MIEEVKAFFDYCIPDTCVTQRNFEEMVKFLFENGYRTIAVSQVVEEAGIEVKTKKKKGEVREPCDIVPAPLEIKPVKVKSENYKKYHIIAVLPLTQNALQFTCSNIEADIFSFEPENRQRYNLNRKVYNQIVKNGMHLEILYSPAIIDITKRRNIIEFSHYFHLYGKSKNVIISSGAQNFTQLRNPYDVMNLAMLFGLNETKARNAINYCGRNVYLHSVSRRLGKAIIYVEGIEKKDLDVSVESDDKMDTDEPAQKKTRH